MKERFNVLQSTLEYLLRVQAQLVIAIVVIHNWIRIFDPQDEEITDEAMGV